MAGFSRLSFAANGFAFHLFASPARREPAARETKIAQGAIVEVSDFRERGAPAKVVPEYPDQ
jgi:hypothetical protein